MSLLNFKLPLVLLVAGFYFAGQMQVRADADKEVMALGDRVQAKVEAGYEQEADFTTELKELDAFIAKYKHTDPEAAAKGALARAMMYRKTFKLLPKAKELLEQIAKDFPGTEVAGVMPEVIADVQLSIQLKAIRDSLKPGTKFPDFAETDINGKPFKLADYQGKVVLVDFWATWCTFCVESLPEVKKAYSKYNKQGFEIVGISLDADKKELTSFIKKKSIKWPQYNDGKEWEGKLALKFGVESLPTTYLVGKDGNIIGKNLEGKELLEAVATAVKK
jgi:peroxiredoxin